MKCQPGTKASRPHQAAKARPVTRKRPRSKATHFSVKVCAPANNHFCSLSQYAHAPVDGTPAANPSQTGPALACTIRRVRDQQPETTRLHPARRSVRLDFGIITKLAN